MSDAWMPHLHVKLSRQEFDQLPRHPAYQYEYQETGATLSPWPRYYHAQLHLAPFPVQDAPGPGMLVRAVRADDLEGMIAVFVAGFARLQPFGSLAIEQSKQAARQCLQRTFDGGDGPLVAAASFLALENERIVGAILITLVRGGNPQEWDSYHWQETPPAHLWEQARGQPHLTWIFVNRSNQGIGAGTHLLQQSVRVLRQQGYESLWTTFMVGNDSSLLWHWRNGFELLPHLLSKRRRHKDMASH